MGSAGFAMDMGWQCHGGSHIRKSKGQTGHMPCVDSSILLAPGVLMDAEPCIKEHHPLPSSGEELGCADTTPSPGRLWGLRQGRPMPRRG